MKARNSREEFHAHILRQIADGELFFSHNAFEAFMKFAARKGFTDEQVLTMATSGMSGAQIFAIIESGPPVAKTPTGK